MQDSTIAEIEKWLRECAQASERKDTSDSAVDPADPAQEQPKYWPYLDSEDFWRE